MVEDILTRLRGECVLGVFAIVVRDGVSFCRVSDSSVGAIGFVCRPLELSARCAAFVAAFCAWGKEVGGGTEDSEGCRPFSGVFGSKNLDLDGNSAEGSGQARKVDIGQNCELCRLVTAPLEEA